MIFRREGFPNVLAALNHLQGTVHADSGAGCQHPCCFMFIYNHFLYMLKVKIFVVAVPSIGFFVPF